jgi:hypothetical protein
MSLKDHLPIEDVRNTEHHWSVGTLEQHSKFSRVEESKREIDLVSRWSVGIDEKICGVHNDSNPQSLGRNGKAIVPAKSEREGIDCLYQNPRFANRRMDCNEQTVSGSLRGVLT